MRQILPDGGGDIQPMDGVCSSEESAGEKAAFLGIAGTFRDLDRTKRQTAQCRLTFYAQGTQKGKSVSLSRRRTHTNTLTHSYNLLLFSLPSGRLQCP